MPRAIPREEVVALGTSSSSTGTVRDLKDQKIIYNPSAVKPIMIHGTQEPAVIIQGSINYGSAKCSSSSSSSGVRKVLPPIKKSRSSSRDHFSTDDIVDHPHQAADLLPVSPFRQQQQQQHIVRLNRYCSSPTQSSDPNHQKSSKITNNRSQEEAGSASPSSKASLYYSNNSQNHKTLDSINISTGTATSSFSSTQIKEPSRKRSNKQLPSSPSSAVSSHPQPPLLPPKTSHTTSSPTATKSNYNYSDSTATYTTVPSTFVARTSLGNWEMGQTIGKGASGSVKLAFNKITNEKVTTTERER